jgi:hypothetical protein
MRSKYEALSSKASITTKKKKKEHQLPNSTNLFLKSGSQSPMLSQDALKLAINSLFTQE